MGKYEFHIFSNIAYPLSNIWTIRLPDSQTRHAVSSLKTNSPERKLWTIVVLFARRWVASAEGRCTTDVDDHFHNKAETHRLIYYKTIKRRFMRKLTSSCVKIGSGPQVHKLKCWLDTERLAKTFFHGQTAMTWLEKADDLSCWRTIMLYFPYMWFHIKTLKESCPPFWLEV